MKTIINQSLIFPRISESRVKSDRINLTHQIKNQILVQMLTNNVSSLYTITKEHSYVSACTAKKKIESKSAKKTMQEVSRRDKPYKIMNKRDIQYFSKRNSICMTDLLPNEQPSLISKRIIHESEENSERRSLQAIRNNLKMKILKFKTEISNEENSETQAGESRQFREIFSIRSLSKSIKAKHAMQYRLQAKKFFKNQAHPNKITTPKRQQTINPKVNELKMTCINGWIIQEQDLNCSNNLCERLSSEYQKI